MQSISVKRTILNDYAAFLLAITGPIFLVLSIAGGVFGFLPEVKRPGSIPVTPETAVVGAIASLVLTLVLLFLLYRRIARIRRIIQTGERVEGGITDIRFIKDRGRVTFRYVLNGQVVEGGAPVMKNATTLQLIPGTVVELALDPEDPSRAIVVELYV